MSVGVKPYGCCRYNHGLIDCILELRREHSIVPDNVEAIRLGVLSAGALLVAEPIERRRTPSNCVDAQFSAPFAAAIALTTGGAGPEAYSEASLSDPVVRSLMARTDCYRDASLDANFPLRWPAAAEIRLRDGRTVATRVEYATGEPENPVSRDALVAKFVGLATTLLTPADAHALAERVLHLEDQPELRPITARLRAPHRRTS
jgi:2-methylcitrate dehydratase PrpD